MPSLFDMKLRAQRRDRAARAGPELFLLERTFADCLERLTLVERRFDRAILIGCPDAGWPGRLTAHANKVEVVDPGPLFASRVGGIVATEDAWQPPIQAHDLILAIGTLDTVNDLPLALRLVRQAMRPDGLFLGAMSGGDTIPKLRAAMRAADMVGGTAAPHVHPRIEAAALAPLLEQARFVRPVVDVDRITVSYRTFEKLIADLRKMGATNILSSRPRFVSETALRTAKSVFETGQHGGRTEETFEILHYAAWTAK